MRELYSDISAFIINIKLIFVIMCLTCKIYAIMNMCLFKVNNFELELGCNGIYLNFIDSLIGIFTMDRTFS